MSGELFEILGKYYGNISDFMGQKWVKSCLKLLDNFEGLIRATAKFNNFKIYITSPGCLTMKSFSGKELKSSSLSLATKEKLNGNINLISICH